MGAKDLAVVLGTALLTMAVATLVRTSLPDAAADGTPKVKAPTMECNGVRFTLVLKEPCAAAGQKPVVTLRAANASGKRVELAVRVSMTAGAIPNPMARMVALPEEVWSHSDLIALRAGEKREVELTTDVALAAGTGVSFNVIAGEQRAQLVSVTIPSLGEVVAPETEQG